MSGTLGCCGGVDRHLAGCKHYGSDRGTGKTTRLWEEAVRLAGEGVEVFITGAHTRWLLDLGRDFKHQGLVGVHVLTIDQIVHRGALRGRMGVLLIDDAWDIPWRDREVLEREQQMLHAKNPLQHARNPRI